MKAHLSEFGSGIDLSIESLVGPEERRALIRDAADELLDEARREMGGTLPKYKLLVDNQPAQNLDRINPDHGVVEYVFEGSAVVEVVEAALDMLRANSPVASGRYRASHRAFADKTDVTDALAAMAPDKAQAVKEFTLWPVIAYGRKVERWHGLYEATTAIMQRRFGNQAAIGFEFRSPLMPYVAGGANRVERQAIRRQPNRRAAMRAERETRLPCISIRPLEG